MLKLLRLAADVARPDKRSLDLRNFCIGAVGIRADGVLVSARNAPAHETNVHDGWTSPSAHAESKCLKKMDYRGVLYVARVTRAGFLAKARPCRFCEKALKARRVSKVFYTISEYEYGVICYDKNQETIKSI